MDPLHVHLLLNHVPVVGLIFTVIVLLFGTVKKNDEIKKLSLKFFVVLSLITVPVYFSGENSEEIVEGLPGISETMIEEHEELAKLAFGSVIVLGLISAVGLFLGKGLNLAPNWVFNLSLALGLLAFGLMGKTANFGGQIRHAEIRSGETTRNLQTQTEKNDDEKKNDDD
ncbi:hypothetical protein IT568_02840 [bacterium]|nr:hypothetical protein [bacterium]